MIYGKYSLEAKQPERKLTEDENLKRRDLRYWLSLLLLHKHTSEHSGERERERDERRDGVKWYGDTKSVLEAKCTLLAELHKETHLNFTFPFPLADTLILSECSKFPLHFLHLTGENVITGEGRKEEKRSSLPNIFHCGAFSGVSESC